MMGQGGSRMAGDGETLLALGGKKKRVLCKKTFIVI